MPHTMTDEENRRGALLSFTAKSSSTLLCFESTNSTRMCAGVVVEKTTKRIHVVLKMRINTPLTNSSTLFLHELPPKLWNIIRNRTRRVLVKMGLQTHDYDGFVSKRFRRNGATNRTNVVLEVHTQTQKLRTSRVIILDPRGPI